MSFSISASSPTSDYRDSLLEKAITGIALKLAKERISGDFPDTPVLDINFLISGKFEQPSFSGMRMGNFDADKKTLYFERAVPTNLIHSDNANKFVKAVLDDAIMNAADYFNEYDIGFDIFTWKGSLRKLN